MCICLSVCLCLSFRLYVFVSGLGITWPFVLLGAPMESLAVGWAGGFGCLLASFLLVVALLIAACGGGAMSSYPIIHATGSYIASTSKSHCSAIVFTLLGISWSCSTLPRRGTPPVCTAPSPPPPPNQTPVPVLFYFLFLQ